MTTSPVTRECALPTPTSIDLLSLINQLINNDQLWRQLDVGTDAVTVGHSFQTSHSMGDL